jgi:outer membrane protein OmpA-like peptidoglycan-associated protein
MGEVCPVFIYCSLKTFSFMKKIFLFVLCGCTLTICAQDVEKDKYSVSGGLLGAINITEFKIGGDNPSNFDYDSKVGWSAGGWVNFPLTSKFSVEPQLMYSVYRYSANTTTPLLLNDGKISYVSIPLLLKFIPTDKFAITAGPQVDFLTSIDDNDNTAVEENFRKTSWSIAGGFEVFPRGRVTIFGRYIHGLSDIDERDTEAGGNLEYRNQNFQLGLKLRLFGGPEKTTAVSAAYVDTDADDDGIEDAIDNCPTVPGLAKYKGCPVPDTDGDGINDELDKCPNQAGVAKYEGCPVPDSDGDGINDELDKCPNQAGLAQYEGCPAPDKDGDGINDDADRCPDIAGTAANNGCPDVPADVTKIVNASAAGIAFGTGSNNAKLSTRSNTSLDRVVKLLNDNPGMKLRIEGHTDNIGEEDDNEDLSSERAKAVMDYFISKGIAEDRLSKEGFGETMPIADNNTAAGRAQNNRIELKIVY